MPKTEEKITFRWGEATPWGNVITNVGVQSIYKRVQSINRIWKTVYSIRMYFVSVSATAVMFDNAVTTATDWNKKTEKHSTFNKNSTKFSINIHLIQFVCITFSVQTIEKCDYASKNVMSMKKAVLSLCRQIDTLLNYKTK